MKRFTGLAVVAAFALAACSQPEKKPVIPPDPDPKNGIVGLVSETKVRDISDRDSFMGALSSIFSGNTDKAVASNYWEVTVFYDDGTTGTVIVDKRPALQPGQKVRVTGNKIELRR